MHNNNNDLEKFNHIKGKLPLIFHHASIYDGNAENNHTITPTIPSKYLMTGKRKATPFYKSISRICLHHINNN